MSIPIHITVIRRARPFDIGSCTESELRRRCRERGLSAENTELAVEFFVKKTRHGELADRLCIAEKSVTTKKNRMKELLC